MKPDISLQLRPFIDRVRALYDAHLKSVILYGSYARGDANSASDIDLMILVDLSDEDIAKLSHQLSDLTFDYNFDHDLLIMPIVKNQSHFDKWLRAYPFYYNVQKEGVVLYAA